MDSPKLKQATKTMKPPGLVPPIGASQLQAKPSVSFVKSWNELLAVLASKSEALQQPA